MLLQGHLQRVFDALYHLGVIDPVLKLDWTTELKNIGAYQCELDEAMRVANRFQSDSHRLMFELEKFDPKILNYLAMEVAREYAEFHARENVH